MRNGCLLFYFSYIIYLIINALFRKYENMRMNLMNQFFFQFVCKLNL